MLAQSNPIVSGAVNVLKDISSDEALRFRAEREMLARLDQIDWEATIREEAREEALDEGRQEERQNTLTTLRGLLASGFPIEALVANSTFSKEEIIGQK